MAELVVNDLPWEMLELIFGFAGPTSIIPIKMTCKHWKGIHKQTISAAMFVIQLAMCKDQHMLTWAAANGFDITMPEVMNVAVYLENWPLMRWLASMGAYVDSRVDRYTLQPATRDWLKKSCKKAPTIPQIRLNTMIKACISTEDIDALERLRASNVYSYECKDLDLAIIMNKTSVVKWFVDRGYVSVSECYATTLHSGNFEMMVALYTSGYEMTLSITKIIKNMTKRNDYKYFGWLVENGLCKDVDLARAVESLYVLKVLHKAGNALESRLYAVAVRYGKLDVIHYLEYNDCPLPSDMYELREALAFCYDTDIRRWAISKKIPRPEIHMSGYIRVEDYFGWDLSKLTKPDRRAMVHPNTNLPDARPPAMPEFPAFTWPD